MLATGFNPNQLAKDELIDFPGVEIPTLNPAFGSPPNHYEPNSTDLVAFAETGWRKNSNIATYFNKKYTIPGHGSTRRLWKTYLRGNTNERDVAAFG